MNRFAMNSIIIVSGAVLLWLFCDCKSKLRIESRRFRQNAESIKKRLESERNLLDNVGKSLIGESVNADIES